MDQAHASTVHLNFLKKNKFLPGVGGTGVGGTGVGGTGVGGTGVGGTMSF